MEPETLQPKLRKSWWIINKISTRGITTYKSHHLTKMWWRDSWKSIPVFSIGPELQCWLSQCSLWLIRILLFSLLSCAWLFATPWTAAWQAFLSSTIIWSLLKLVSIESVMLSNHLILCRPLLLLPSVFPRISLF